MDTNGGPRCLCDEFVPVTEAAALAAGHWTGRGDGKAAVAAASEALNKALAGVPIEGTVVIGESELEATLLRPGDRVGAGGRLCETWRWSRWSAVTRWPGARVAPCRSWQWGPLGP